MDQHRRVLPLVAIMAVTVIAAIGITYQGLYRTAFERQQAMLVETVTTQARLIEAVARFDAIYSVHDHPEGAVGATLSQIRDAYFPETGPDSVAELILARKTGDQITFLSARRQAGNEVPETLPYSGNLAEPMRLALSGKSGTVVGPDYKDTQVLAAYEPVAELNLGLVAKVDLSTVRAPFLKSFAVNSGLALVILGIGTLLFLRLHRRLSERIEESEAGLREAQRIAHIGHWEMNLTSGAITWSEECSRVLTGSPDNTLVTYEQFEAALHPDDRKPVKEVVAQAVADKKDIQAEYRVVHSNGTQRTVLARWKVSVDAVSGEPRFTIGTVQDITERKQMEKALRVSEEQYRTMIASSHEVIFCKDRDGRYHSLNLNAAVGLDGTCIEDIQGKTDYDLLPREQAVRLRKTDQVVMDRGEVIETEEIVPGPQGQTSTYLSRKWPTYDDAGNVSGIGCFAIDITKHKQLEEARHLSEQRFALAFRASPDSITITRLSDGLLVEVNQAFEKMFCLSREAAIGQTTVALKLWPDSAARKKITDQIASKSAIRDLECQLRRTSGELFDALVSGEIIELNGEDHFLSVVRDITERKKLEHDLEQARDHLQERVDERTAALQASQESYARAQAIAHIGHWEWRVDPNQVTWSDECYRIFGRTPEELGNTYEGFLATLHADDRERTAAAVMESIQTGKPYRADYRVVYPGGETICHVQAQGEATLDPETGGPLSLMGTILDVTDRVEAKAALERSEEHLRAVTDHIDEVFWLTDAGLQNTIYVSPAYEKVWGRTCEDLISNPASWMEAIHPDDATGMMEDFTPCVEEGLEFDHQYRIIRPDGEVRWIHDRGYPIRDETGSVQRWTGIAEDVTEHKKIEAELREAQRMEALGNLAGGIAHSLNNLLLPILALSRMARDGLPAENPSREYLTRVMEAGERARDLTSRILTFSRRDDPQPVDANIHDIVSRAVGLLRPTLPSTIRLQTELQQDTGTIFADPAQIESVLMNLASNAVDALDGRTGKVAISLMREVNKKQGDAEPDAYATLTVSDDGPGMERKVREQAFDPFYTTKEVGEGTGLGLSMAHGIISAHGGSLKLVSAPGEGTTVTVRMPLKDGKGEAVTLEQGAV